MSGLVDAIGGLRYAQGLTAGFDIGSSGLLESLFPNLLQHTNGMTSFGTVNATLTFNNSVSPDGTSDATLWQRSSTAAAYAGFQISKPQAAYTYTLSLFAKVGSGDYCALRMQGTYPDRADVVFNLATGAISTAPFVSGNYAAPFSAGILPGPNGWCRLWLTATTSGTDSNDVISHNWSGSSNGVVLDGTDSVANTTILGFGAMLTRAPLVTPYLPVP